MKINGGNDNLIENNIFVDCLTALYANNFLNGWGSFWIDDTSENGGYILDKWEDEFKNINYYEPPYSEKYPLLINFFNEDHRKHARNRFEKNVIYNCGQIYREGYEPIIKKKDNFNALTDPGFIDAANLNFQLKDNSVVYKRIPGFKKIPFKKIGLYKRLYFPKRIMLSNEL